MGDVLEDLLELVETRRREVMLVDRVRGEGLQLGGVDLVSDSDDEDFCSLGLGSVRRIFPWEDIQSLGTGKVGKKYRGGFRVGCSGRRSSALRKGYIVLIFFK